MNEREIIRSVLGGDTRRFEALVDRYLPVVRGLCAGRVFNSSAHEDLVQETFIDVYLHLDRLRNPDRFGPWLVAIAKNKCSEWLRQQGRRERLTERLAESAPASVDPSREATRQELREWVRQRIAALPEKLRDAMMLCYGEGLSTAEAAKCLGIRESALRKRLQYGRQAIGTEMMAEYKESIGPSDSERLRGKVLAAIPLGSVPWRSATALSTLLASKAVIFGLRAVVVLALVGVATQFVLTRGGDAEPGAAASKPGVVAQNVDPEASQASGRIDVSVRRATGWEPLPHLSVMATPMQWDDKAWEEMLRGAGTPLRYKDLFAPSFRDNMPKERLKELWARQGLNAAEIAEAEKHLDAFYSAFMQGRLPANTRIPLHGDASLARSADTDDSGHATFAGLPPGNYSLTVRGSKEEETLGSVFAAVQTDRTTKADILLRPQQSAIATLPVVGQVLSEKTGEGIAGARVEVSASKDFTSSGFAETDAQGIFRLTPFVFPAGALFARATAGKAESKVVEFEHKDTGDTNETVIIQIPLVPRGTISGRVTTADGRPVAKAPIMLKSVKGNLANSVAHTDEEGRYSFVHDGGVLVLYAQAYTAKSEELTLELAMDESRTQDFVLPNTARALFDIRLPEGSRPEKITSFFFYSTDDQSWASNAELTRQGEHFVLPHLKPAAYRIVVVGDGFEGRALNFVVDEALTDVTQTLLVQPATTSARILVQDAEGKPAAKARVSAMWRYGTKFDSGEDTSTYSATSIVAVETGADGIAEFRGLPPARYDFTEDGNYPLMLKDVDVPCNRLLQMSRSDAAYPPATAISLESYPFRLIDAMHGGARLNYGSYLDWRDAAIFALTPSGRPSESDLEVGSNTVYIVKRGYTAGVCTVEVTADMIGPEKHGELKPVDVVLGEAGTVSGYLDCPDGTPVAGRDLGAFPAELWEAATADKVADRGDWARFGRILAQHAATGDDGSFSVRFLPPGPYVLATDTNKPGVLLVSEPVTVVAGKETTGVVLTEFAVEAE